ncbi:hypothetical protein EVAR_77225_1 [Eumeta japonica]|uniref:Uncharacterized protein n=1 Tax=Eumeta variegata TaxID=151549 RepID=A0A4C1T521_EUMVA|nr:hypothetical protein EVAR_77225_1 [Eumeta japonica]
MVRPLVFVKTFKLGNLRLTLRDWPKEEDAETIIFRSNFSKPREAHAKTEELCFDFKKSKDSQGWPAGSTVFPIFMPHTFLTRNQARAALDDRHKTPRIIIGRTNRSSGSLLVLRVFNFVDVTGASLSGGGRGAGAGGGRLRRQYLNATRFR